MNFWKFIFGILSFIFFNNSLNCCEIKETIEKKDIPFKVLVIAQGNLNLYLESLPEFDSHKIHFIAEKNTSINSSKIEPGHLYLVDEYFESGEVELAAFNLCQQEGYQIIIACSESDILRAAKLRSIFKIQGQSYESALAFRDKILMKTILQDAGIKVPKFAKASSVFDILLFKQQNLLPVILKPCRGYGSVGTRVLNSEQEMENLIRQPKIFGEFHNTDLEVEQFIEAKMYHIDGIIRNGEIVACWPSRCINTCIDMVKGKPTGGYLLSPGNPLVLTLTEYARKILQILPTPYNSGFHLEIFYDKEPIFCEIASRIGGPWINEIWIKGIGIDLKKEFIRAQALLPSFIKTDACQPKQILGGMIFPPHSGKVIFIPKECSIPGVLDYSSCLVEGEKLSMPISMLDHIASFTLRADSEKAMEDLIIKVTKWFEMNLIMQCDEE